MKRDKVKFFVFCIPNEFKYRFIVEFPTSRGLLNIDMFAKSKPSIQISQGDFFARRTLQMTQTRLNPLEVRLSIDNLDGIAEFNDWISREYNYDESVYARKKDLTLRYINSFGNLIETFILHGAFITSYCMEYQEDGTINYELTIDMDKFVLIA